MAQEAGHRGTTATSAGLRDYVDLVRPSQWIKNVVVFAGPAAGLKLTSLVAAGQALVAFACFCAVSSSAYIINDILDRKADARHPRKRERPIARGAIGAPTGLAVAVMLAAASTTATAVVLNLRVTAVVLAYLVLTVSYSLGLKERVILDVIVVATGFVLRAWAGSLAVDVTTSAWLVACVFTLCLFMGFGKRRCELAMISDVHEAGEHRRTLLRYTPDLLNHLITVSAGIAVITFLLYTMDTVHPSPFSKEYLFYTLPLVVYGIFRFAMLTELGRYSGPTEIVLRDRPLMGTILLWALLVLAIAYEKRVFGPEGLAGLFT